ncbi:DUF262 domain-containing protein [Nonomuraea sp. B5E05]|uniref:DUF262 domain-containing protein n=1 Tax=Nonomuraea sp. B5E05 TaxID=3153569 RepID=UPI003261AB0E
MSDESSSQGQQESDPASESAFLLQEDVETLEEADPEPPRVAYTSSDFDVEGLVRRLKRGDIAIPTFGHNDDPPIETARFQRGFVWNRPQMDRFIESLLLGYPIPGIFLVQQLDRRYLVLDGQQRLRTLAAFYEGMHDKKEFALKNVADKFAGLSYRTLGDELRRTLDNTFLQATIVQTDGSTESLDAVYQVFERLNSGGTQLTPHEIRVALHAGPFIDLITNLNNDANWRLLYGRPSPRLRDQEVILRIIALYVSPGNYKRPLKKFLNEFVGNNRYLTSIEADTISNRFSRAAALIRIEAGPQSLRRQSAQINTALTEAIFVGLMRRLDVDDQVDATAVADRINALSTNKRLEPAIARATADEESVRVRLALSTQAFASI